MHFSSVVTIGCHNRGHFREVTSAGRQDGGTFGGGRTEDSCPTPSGPVSPHRGSRMSQSGVVVGVVRWRIRRWRGWKRVSRPPPSGLESPSSWCGIAPTPSPGARRRRWRGDVDVVVCGASVPGLQMEVRRRQMGGGPRHPPDPRPLIITWRSLPAVDPGGSDSR